MSKRSPMKFAPTCPTQIYRGMFDAGYIPNTVLLLAHDVIKHEKEYNYLFNDYFMTSKRFSLDDKPFIIMDNSLIELQQAIDLFQMKDAMDIVNADVATLPDHLNDGYQTRKKIDEVYDSWQYALGEENLMALIQGKTITDWLHTAEEVLNNFPIGMVGIPRCTEFWKPHHLTDTKYHRKDLVQYASMIFGKDMPIHLFGFSDFVWHDLEAAKHSQVKSIDSAAPFRMNSKYVFSSFTSPRGETWWDDVKWQPAFLDTMSELEFRITGRSVTLLD